MKSVRYFVAMKMELNIPKHYVRKRKCKVSQSHFSRDRLDLLCNLVLQTPLIFERHEKRLKRYRG